MSKTNIEWVVNPDGSRPGYTWNPITGCLNHIDGMCKGGGFPCYAYKLANGRLKPVYLANENILFSNYIIRRTPYSKMTARQTMTIPFHPRLWPERLIDVPFTKKPLGIFVCDMGELFGDWLPDWWIEKVFKTINTHPEHRFYLLTKQPQNLIKFSPFPDNCWVGVTVTGGDILLPTLDALDNIRCKLRYLSIEPLLNKFSPYDLRFLGGTVDWLIIGAQTKPYKPPKWEWVSEIIDACVDAGIPYFLKNNLEKVVPRTSGGFQLGELRQEMPV